MKTEALLLFFSSPDRIMKRKALWHGRKASTR